MLMRIYPTRLLGTRDHFLCFQLFDRFSYQSFRILSVQFPDQKFPSSNWAPMKMFSIVRKLETIPTRVKEMKVKNLGTNQVSYTRADFKLNRIYIGESNRNYLTAANQFQTFL